MKKIILLVIFFISFLGGKAQNAFLRHYFRCYNSEQGLSQTDVKAILQDSRGFMWFGTKNKLNRFDGYFMRTFDCFDNLKGVRNNNISSLFEDSNNKIWVGTDNGVFIYNPLNECFSFIDDKTDDGYEMTDWVSDIKSDNKGNVWIVLPNQGLFCMSPDSKLMHFNFGEENLPDHGSPQCICVDKNGFVWIGTNGKGIYLFNSDKKEFVQYLGDSTGATLEGENIYRLCDNGTELVIGVHEGKLRRLNKRRNIVSDFETPEIHYQIIRDLNYIDDELWVATQSGIFIVNENEGSVEHVFKDPMCLYSLTDNQVNRIYKDRENGVWVGTNIGGVNYLPNYSMNFIRHVPTSDSHSINSKRVREIVEDSQGRIWVGTEDMGINIYDPAEKTFNSKISKSDFNHKGRTLSMHNVNGDIWVGYFKNGLDVFNVSNGSVTHYFDKDLNLNESSIYALCKDSEGNVWIGNGWGVYVCDPKTMKTRHMEEFGMNYIFDIIEGSDKSIWVATMGNGVFRYSPGSGKTKHYRHSENDMASLSSNSVNGIFETSDGTIWFSTDRGGICRFDKDNDNFHTISLAQGLPDDTSYKILEDKNNKLWFGTNNGLVSFDPKNEKIDIYTTLDGLPSNQFNYKSGLIGSNGIFYFGTSEGLISFDPYHSMPNLYVPPVLITSVTINGDEHYVLGNEQDKTSVSDLKHLNLDYGQNNFKVNFASLSFTEPRANKYAYKLDKIDDDWVYTSETHSDSYANLFPGTYTFMVKGSNNSGLWQEEPTRMIIRVAAPWYMSVWAWCIYILLFIALIIAIIWYTRKMEYKKGKARQEKFEDDKEKELYRYKMDFFTQIAHEIRTPLTLINGPLESMLEKKPNDPELRDNLKIMSRNTSELMSLINQLLDYRKLENKKMDIALKPVDIMEVLTEQFQRFRSMAISEGRQMTISTLKTHPYVLADKNTLVKIFSNLFSNAIKYSNYTIEINVVDENNNVKINFLNDGNLIPDKYKELIYEPFFQLKENENIQGTSGIGLSLVRSFVELLRGSITYSHHNNLNCFTLEFPVVSDYAPTHILPDVIDDETELPQKEEPINLTLLVVEDNNEMRNFIINKLKHSFNVIGASDASEAIQLLKDNQVDLIISDIMMPGMNGLEFCNYVKNTLEYSHIPVILLSAKDDVVSKIQGLKYGANVYIEKPFSFNHLMAQINSILENQERERKSFSRDPLNIVSQSGLNKADQDFIQKLTKIVHDNIIDPNFGVEKLSELIFMSRSSLHRKIKVVTGLSPTEFIRVIRLKKAAELLSEGKYRTGEVCYHVGINSASYFIKQFQKQFGMTPKEFEKQCRMQKNNTNLDF
ncbi:MAG: response regulator [Muribaculaceae bacterium]|nr:response regulator [Muribaculaceae bacterium]